MSIPSTHALHALTTAPAARQSIHALTVAVGSATILHSIPATFVQNTVLSAHSKSQVNLQSAQPVRTRTISIPAVSVSNALPTASHATALQDSALVVLLIISSTPLQAHVFNAYPSVRHAKTKYIALLARPHSI